MSAEYVFSDVETGARLAVQPRALPTPPRSQRKTNLARLAAAAEDGASFLRGDLIAAEAERHRGAIADAVATIIAALDALDPDCDLEDGGDDELSCAGVSSQFSNWRLTFRTLGDGNTIDTSYRPPDVRTADPAWQTLRIVRERDRMRFPGLPSLNDAR